MASSSYSERRLRFLQQMGERAIAIIHAAPVAIRNNDVEHDYRQDSDFFYLTGLDEPESVLILSTVHEHSAVLFVRPRNPEREVWDGPRIGVDGAKALGVSAAFESKLLRSKLVSYLEDAETLHFRLGVDRDRDDVVLASIEAARRRHRFGHAYPGTIVDPSLILHEMRLIKDAGEIEIMRRAAAITAEAHAAAMRVARPGGYEFEVEAEIQRVFRKAGCERPAYGSIVGSGPNATILHHRRNDRHMQESDLLLIDAGCEFGYYACDVTRTFPISGGFTEAQRAIYEVVLEAQLACIAAVKPGATLDAIHNVAVERITHGLVALGLVEGPVEEAIEEQRYKALFMHRTSHWLGMDVHDVGPYYDRGDARPLAPGHVLTIEPGVYIGANAEVEEQWRGIGVRIEDDILVTEDGHDNLTIAIPKAPDELEQLLDAR